MLIFYSLISGKGMMGKSQMLPLATIVPMTERKKRLIFPLENDCQMIGENDCVIVAEFIRQPAILLSEPIVVKVAEEMRQADEDLRLRKLLRRPVSPSLLENVHAAKAGFDWFNNSNSELDLGTN